jgi:hypothetical protein
MFMACATEYRLRKEGKQVALSGTAKVWAGSADLPLATEELARMEELGWFTDEDSWSAFT